MSVYSEEFSLPLSANESARICNHVAHELGWNLAEHGESRMVYEYQPSLTAFPARVEILLESKSYGISTVMMKGSVKGAGAFQPRYVAGPMSEFRKRIELIAEKRESPLVGRLITILVRIGQRKAILNASFRMR